MKQRLTEDMKTALRAKDKVRLSIVRMMKNEIDKREIDTRKQLTEVEEVETITSYKKIVIQQLGYAVDAKNEAKIAEFTNEIAVISSYLPQQLSESEVESLIQSLIAQHAFSGAKDKGALMKVLMPEVKGKADGKLVSEIVTRLLS